MDKVIQWLNWILVVDFFFVLFSLAWLAVAVAGRASGIDLGLDLWYGLWEPLFTPAIGLLMGGAILTGVVGQVRKRLQSNSKI